MWRSKRSRLPFETRHRLTHVRRRIRDALVLAVLSVALFDWAGMPYLRTSYQYVGDFRRPTIRSAIYWSFAGSRPATAFEADKGFPGFVLVPLDPPLRRQIADWARSCFTSHPEPEEQ